MSARQAAPDERMRKRRIPSRRPRYDGRLCYATAPENALGLRQHRRDQPGGRLSEDDHLRPDPRAVVEVDNVGIDQADAARRDVEADAPGFVGAVDAEKRVA